MPAYNAGKFIEEAIQSVVNQNYDNWELIILVDGGSGDNTASLVRQRAQGDSRIKYQEHSHRRMASARNLGIKMAVGQYVSFLDADNLFLKNKLAEQVLFLENNPQADICYSRIYHFYDQWPQLLYQNKNEFHHLPKDFFRALLNNNFINVLSVMIRKRALDQCGGFPEGWSNCEDHFFWINLCYRGAVFLPLDRPVGLLRLHSANDSFSKGFLLQTSLDFHILLKTVEGWLSLEEKKKYEEDLTRQYRYQKKISLVGKFLTNPLFSWFFMPVFLYRRRRAYYLIGDRKAVLPHETEV